MKINSAALTSSTVSRRMGSCLSCHQPTPPKRGLRRRGCATSIAIPPLKMGPPPGGTHLPIQPELTAAKYLVVPLLNKAFLLGSGPDVILIDHVHFRNGHSAFYQRYIHYGHHVGGSKQVHGPLTEHPVVEDLGCLHLLASLDQGHGGNLITRTFLGEADSHRITLLYNGNLVVGIADAYSHLTQTNGLVGGVARAGVLLNVLVELLQVGKGLVFAPELNQSGDEVIGCTGGTGVGHLDFTLQLRPEQILPGGWRLDAELSQTLVVGDKAQG